MPGRHIIWLLTATAVLIATLHCSCMAVTGTRRALPACCQKNGHSTAPARSGEACPHCSGGMVLTQGGSVGSAVIATDVTFVLLPTFRSAIAEPVAHLPKQPRSHSPPRADTGTLFTLHSLLTV